VISHNSSKGVLAQHKEQSLRKMWEYNINIIEKQKINFC
jgi:hypothetical protein